MMACTMCILRCAGDRRTIYTRATVHFVYVGLTQARPDNDTAAINFDVVCVHDDLAIPPHM